MREPVIDLRLWRQFLAVSEELHFGRAARRLHMTQPPLTQGIAQLERHLGLRVFERSKRRVSLTAAGEALVPEVRDLLARATRLNAVARAAAAGESGHLRLAFVSTVGFTMLPGWVRAYRESYPGVELELLEATGDVQLEALARGSLDGGVLLHSPGVLPIEFHAMSVDRETLVIALPKRHPLARHTELDVQALVGEPLVIFPRRIAPSLHDAILALYHAAGVTPRIAQQAVQMQTIVNLVSAGLGVAWVPASVRQFQRPGVVYREVRSQRGRRRLRLPECETSLVWHGEPGPTMQNFIALAKAAARLTSQ